MAPGRWRNVAIAAIVVALALDVVWVSLAVWPSNGNGAAACLVPPVPCLFDIHGEVYIGTDSGGGMLNVTVSNLANYPMSNITFVDAGPGLVGLAVFTPFTYHGMVVSDTNQLAIGDRSTGYFQFTSGGSAATTYTVTVRATLANGQVVTEKTNIVSDS